MRKNGHHVYLFYICILIYGNAVFSQMRQPSIQGIKPPPTPQFVPFIPLNPGKSPAINQINNNFNQPSISPDQIQKSQQGQIFRANGAVNKQEQVRILKIELDESKREAAYREYQRKSKIYQDAYAQLMAIGKEGFSITKAVYIVENAFFENRLDYRNFLTAVQQKTDLCRQIIKTVKLNSDDNLVKNYAIQKLFSEGTQVYDPKTQKFKRVKPFLYDFEDFFGERDWTKMFVTKLLAKGTGQCHSMPLAHLILAEQLNAKVWLSLAPEHSYIKFPTANGNIYNFETTQGKIVSDHAIVASGFITPAAIKNRTYMDTLSKQQLFAQMLVDLVHGYRMKTGYYDQFAEGVINKALEVDSGNIRALSTKAEIYSLQFERAADMVGRPPVDHLPMYPPLYKLYQQRNDLYEKIDNIGYRQMPMDAYRQWLQSLKNEKQERESKELQEHVKQLLKHTKPVLTNKSKQ